MNDHNIGDIVMGVNAYEEKVLGIIKAIDPDGEEYNYQVEWANDLHCDEWYGESNMFAFKETYQEYMNEQS